VPISANESAALALLSQAKTLLDRLRRTSRDAYYADEAADAVTEAQAAVVEDKPLDAAGHIDWAAGRLVHYIDPTPHQKELISAKDGQLAKQITSKLTEATIKLASEHKVQLPGKRAGLFRREPSRGRRRFGNTAPPTVRLIRSTFSRITPGEGDDDEPDEEHGWIDEEGVDMEPDEYDREEGLTAVDKAVKFLEREGVMEASSSAFHPGVWYSTEYSVTDYSTGEEEQRSYHLKGFTPDEEREVHRALKSGRHI
jgi:hypothetical protein